MKKFNFPNVFYEIHKERGNNFVYFEGLKKSLGVKIERRYFMKELSPLKIRKSYAEFVSLLG